MKGRACWLGEDQQTSYFCCLSVQSGMRMWLWRVCEISWVCWNGEQLSGLFGHEIRRMIGALDVECERERGNVCVRGGMPTEFWWRNVQERDHLQVLGVNGRIICRNKMQTRYNRWIFIADLTACSTCFGHHYAHHQELESIIQVVAACRIWCLVFKLSVWCGQTAACRIWCLVFKLSVRCGQTATTCIILSSSWWWA
jgi:hypothetical protein